MTGDLHGYRIVTASAYPGMMAPLTGHPSCVCVLSGDADPAVDGLSLEGRDGVRRRWRFGDVAQLASFVPWVLADEQDDRPVLLVPPRASADWEAVQRGRVRLLASPRSAVEGIAEDKIFVREAVQRWGVPVPEQMVLHRSDVDFDSVGARLGTPFVLQAPSGAGGQGTHLVQEPGDLALALARQPLVDKWLASRYAGDVTVNIAGVVHFDGVHLMPPSVQASGLAQLGFSFGGYCGSDFHPGAANPKVTEIGVAVGEWLRRRGHRGIFGVDIAVDGDDVALLEVNPRIQGSSWLLSTIQQRQGDVPSLIQHVQALLGMPLGRDLMVTPELTGQGSHLLVRWRGRTGVVLERPALDTGSVDVSAMPSLGTRIEPGAIIARLAAPHSLAAADGRNLTAATATLVDHLVGGFTIDTARQPEMS
jgi:hypothetical protein